LLLEGELLLPKGCVVGGLLLVEGGSGILGLEDSLLAFFH
jgi:hypothetical protein